MSLSARDLRPASVRTLSLAVALAAVVGVALAAAATPGRAAATRPHVTLFGDSVADAIEFTPDARDVLGYGIDLDLQLAPCRRLAQDSCPYNGSRPPTVIDLVRSIGSRIGPTVIVAVGYNDFEAAYPDNIENVLAAFRGAGVTKVLWVTLRAERHSYLTMNDAIRDAAARHPELTIVDWNLYSRSHPDWFQSDGLHLNPTGSVAMATLFHKALVAAGVAPERPIVAKLLVSVARLPDARVGATYNARLQARGGIKPYRWRSQQALPRGLHLLADGRIRGMPVRPGTFSILMQVSDAQSNAATRRVVLRVRGS
jgi:hypothetical protein